MASFCLFNSVWFLTSAAEKMTFVTGSYAPTLVEVFWLPLTGEVSLLLIIGIIVKGTFSGTPTWHVVLIRRGVGWVVWESTSACRALWDCWCPGTVSQAFWFYGKRWCRQSKVTSALTDSPRRNFCAVRINVTTSPASKLSGFISGGFFDQFGAWTYLRSWGTFVSTRAGAGGKAAVREKAAGRASSKVQEGEEVALLITLTGIVASFGIRDWVVLQHISRGCRITECVAEETVWPDGEMKCFRFSGVLVNLTSLWQGRPCIIWWVEGQQC